MIAPPTQTNTNYGDDESYEKEGGQADVLSQEELDQLNDFMESVESRNWNEISSFEGTSTSTFDMSAQTEESKNSIKEASGRYSVSSDGAEFGHANSAELFDTELGETDDLFFNNDGNIKAFKTSSFKADDFEAKDIENLDYDGNKVTFDSAEDIKTGIFEFDELGKSEIHTDGKKVDITFPDDKTFTFDNPFSEDDSDNDGLPDDIEKKLGLDPNKKDSNNNGFFQI